MSGVIDPDHQEQIRLLLHNTVRRRFLEPRAFYETPLSVLQCLEIKVNGRLKQLSTIKTADVSFPQEWRFGLFHQVKNHHQLRFG